MNLPYKNQLEELGLSPAEAQVYLALLQHGPLAAAAIANETGRTRTSIYPVICSLADKGLLEGGEGYGSKFAAVAPEEALPLLVAREKQSIAERERMALDLAKNLAPLAADPEAALDDTVQVVRTPQVISERFHRLQLETQRHIESFVKAPILNFRQMNPAQEEAQKRGVLYRGLYERAAIEDPKIKPFLEEWIAGGEDARVYDGELPYKLVIFDREIVLLTLVRRGGQTSAMFVRHAPYARSMGVLFDYFWQYSRPLDARQLKKRETILGNSEEATKTRERVRPPLSRNGRRGHYTKK